MARKKRVAAKSESAAGASHGLEADNVLANPPSNDRDWRGELRLDDAKRFVGSEIT